MRGPNIDSDHYLLKIMVHQKLPKIYLNKNRDHTGMWDKSKLKKPIKLQEYRSVLYTKLLKQTQHQEMEQDWEQIKMEITEAANEVVCFLLGDSLASENYILTFQNTLSVPSS